MKICPYCNQPILKDEARVFIEGEYYHIHCAAEESDGQDLDNKVDD